MSLRSGKSPSGSWGGGGIKRILCDETSSACVGPIDLAECGVYSSLRPGLSAIRMLRIFIIISIVRLLPFVQILSLDLRMIFTAVWARDTRLSGNHTLQGEGPIGV